MRTKLSAYAEGVMEACWLAAVILVPLFFNIYSSRIFEPDKLAVLRSLALVILAAWVVKTIEDGRPSLARFSTGTSFLRSVLRIPLVAPVLAFALVYVLSTVFSVASRISLIGSYQRLQGTYTTLSYLVVFGAIATNLRRRSQVERLITTMILVSLPVSLYGVLQRFQIDPVPWGGDVSIRIASNMGNPIFLAAYLIMVAPLTYGRIVESFAAILNETGHLSAQFARSTVYVFIAILQLYALVVSGSRGPVLGWLAGAFFLSILLSLHWRRRGLTLATVGSAAFLAIFLVLLNLPNGPLEALRSAPGLGRLGRVFEVDQGTGLVRVLIWQGAAELVEPHAPISYPDGRTDALNFIRPLIGYGPESMHMAYNAFFPPQLAQLEARNASPDRSHNETWDALVTTGLIGLIVYLFLFGTIFYFGLRWLGLIPGARQRNLFLGLFVVGGVVGAAGLVAWQGIEFFGVGLPFGVILGIILYLTIIALTGQYELIDSQGNTDRALVLMVILSSMVAHFVEINFGIAIAATRTYFWVNAALLLVVGYVLPVYGSYGDGAAAEVHNSSAVPDPKPETAGATSRRRRRKTKRSTFRSQETPVRSMVTGGILLALVLATLGYAYINMQSGPTSPTDAIWNSLTRLPNRGGAVSFGILAMIVTVWLAAGVVYTSEFGRGEIYHEWVTLLVILGTSAILALFFWVWHSAVLFGIALTSSTSEVDMLVRAAWFEGLLSNFYLYALVLIAILGRALPGAWPLRFTGKRWNGWVIAPALLLLALGGAVISNLRIIQADIAFKLADPLSRQGLFDGAISLYRHANDYAATQDHYYLFLGKAYLDSAQIVGDLAERQARVESAEASLLEAQTLNPLNTDHTANLARLYRWWATNLQIGTQDRSLMETAADYYDQALVLSPNNAALWGESATLYITVLDQPEEALERLTRAVEIDPLYDVSHALLGDYYVRQSQDADRPDAKREALAQAASQYEKAVELARSDQIGSQYNYRIALAGVYAELDRTEQAIETYKRALELAPNEAQTWRVEETLVSLYIKLGDRFGALTHANNALVAAPQSEKARLQNLLEQLSGTP